MPETKPEPIWNKFLTERDKQVFGNAGYATRAGFGKRPALLVIDVNYAFCGDRREPILESVKRWRNSCGEDAWDALPVLQALIETARAREVPVIYTTGVRRADNWDNGSWSWKNKRAVENTVRHTNHDHHEIMPQIAPGPRDIVIPKQKPSAFFGTNLMSYIMLLGCDSLLVTGTTTSGCVRASVLDAFSNNIRCTVIEDGCFDRSQASHAINLCDMNAKYADVIRSDEALDYLRGIEPGLFDLPPGVKEKSAI
jgi:maleamate amidohydrolase